MSSPITAASRNPRNLEKIETKEPLDKSTKAGCLEAIVRANLAKGDVEGAKQLIAQIGDTKIHPLVLKPGKNQIF